MKCLLKYPWVKLPRNKVPGGKGLLGAWMRLAARAAFRKGEGHYCGYDNPVEPGMWVGGVVGLKAILGIRSRNVALDVVQELEQLGFLSWSLEPSTKKLSYSLSDWFARFSGAECMDGAVYTTEGYGFVCVSREITQRLVDHNYIFEDAEALLDLWCHTTVNDPGNAFSFLAPSVQYGKYGVILTLETLGRRWGWEKTKVWRFFQAHGDVFALRRLPGSLGCLIFNLGYPCEIEVSARTLRTVGEGVLEATNGEGSALWYNSAFYDEPDAPHTIMQAANGTDWYAMQPHAMTPDFEPASGTMFYDTAQYAAPSGDYKVYEDRNGSQWYAVRGDAAVDRKPVYEHGKPVYDGEKLRTVNVETVRYHSTPSRFAAPAKRKPEIKAPKRKR